MAQEEEVHSPNQSLMTRGYYAEEDGGVLLEGVGLVFHELSVLSAGRGACLKEIVNAGEKMVALSKNIV